MLLTSPDADPRTWSGLVSECDTMDNQDCETKSQLEVLASSVAVLMLLVGPIRAEDEQTLISTPPLDGILFGKMPPEVSWRMIGWRCLVLMPLQLLWSMRSLFLPTLACFGTSVAMSNADTAVDVRTRAPSRVLLSILHV